MPIKLENQLSVIARKPIDYMADGNACMRIAHIWFGWDDENDIPDRYCTVTGIYTFSNKQITRVFPLRSESAMSFASEMPPVDTLSVEVMVHWSKFRKCIQELSAALLVSRVVPVMNPIIAMFFRANIAYEEFPDEADYKGDIDKFRKDSMLAYARFPLMVDVSNISLETTDKPNELRMMITMKHVLTINTKKERQRYLKKLDDVVTQYNIMRTITESRGRNKRLDALGDLFGVRTKGIRDMMARITDRKNGAVISGNAIPGEYIGGVFAFHADGVFAGTRKTERYGWYDTCAGTIHESSLQEYDKLLPFFLDEKIDRIGRTVMAARPALEKATILVIHGIGDAYSAGQVIVSVKKRSEFAGAMVGFFNSGKTMSVILARNGKHVTNVSVTGIPSVIPVVKGFSERSNPDSDLYSMAIDVSELEQDKAKEAVILACGMLNSCVPNTGETRAGMALVVHSTMNRLEWSSVVTDERLKSWFDSGSYAIGSRGNAMVNGEWVMHDHILMPRYMFKGSTSPSPRTVFSNTSGMCSGMPNAVNPATGVPMRFVGTSEKDVVGLSMYLPIYAMTSMVSVDSKNTIPDDPNYSITWG